MPTSQKDALMELQGRLAEKLQAVRVVSSPTGWLAVECAGQPLLLPLSDAGEIFPVSTILPVPYTRRWFLGVTNLRGVLVGVVDLGAFLGLRDGRGGSTRDQARIIALSSGLEVNAALLVDRLAGLRNPTQLTLVAENLPGQPAFASAQYQDESGKIWQELRLSLLCRDEQFLQILDRA